ncbi:MAG: hypothetical protein J6M35_06890 [Clostridia bacterium]|nr:hypothetical protein [Clostridia bacterium]
MTASHRFSSYFLRAVLFLIISTVIFFAALLPSLADAAEDNITGLDIEVYLNKKSYTKGEGATITLSVTNNTGKTLTGLSARYYLPDCFDVATAPSTDISRLTPRQNVKTQIYATANKDIDLIESVNVEVEKESIYDYLIIMAIILAFISAIAGIFFIAEKRRKKTAATISFVFALIISASVALVPFGSIFADSGDPIYTEDMTYSEACEIIKLISPEKASEIIKYLDGDSPLTREKAAVISALMISGKTPLPEVCNKSFLDISSDSFTLPYVSHSINEKIIPEISSGIFIPDRAVSGHEFIEYILRAVGFGKNGEYDTQNKLAFICADALNLTHAELSSLLKKDTLKCSEALCHAVRLMMYTSADISDGQSEYTLSSSSLISYFDGVTEKKAIRTGDDGTYLSENGKNLKLSDKYATKDSYIITYFKDSPIAVTPDPATIGQSCIILDANGKSCFLGASVEYTRYAVESKYSALFGTFNTSGEIFTSGNTHYVTDKQALDKTEYLLDSVVTSKDGIDFGRDIVLIASYDNRSLSYSISDVLYAYQSSTPVPASYESYNTSLSYAKSISNGQKTYMQSAYDKFSQKVDEIDTSLIKTLNDSADSRAAIAIAKKAIDNAVSELEKCKIVSYTALDEQIAIAETLINAEGDYTEESFAPFKEAYYSAKSASRELVVGEKNEAFISHLERALSDTMAALEMSKYCNYTEYYIALEKANAITNDSGKYPASQFSSFQKKIKNIDKGLNKKLTRSDANQKKVDTACNNILNAITNLNYNIPCDYSRLDAAIEVALTYENSNFYWTASSFSALQDALKAAQKVERNMTVGYGTTNQDTITAAATYLTASIKNLKKNKLCDYTAYNKALNDAKAITNEEGLYGETEFTLFTDTLVKIDERLPKDLYRADETNALIAKAVSDIAKAIELLKEPESCDYTELDKALALAEDTLKDGKEYTVASLKALSDAIEAAKALERDLLSDALGERQSLIDSAAASINEAVKALVIQETFSSEIISLTEKTVTVDKEKVTQIFIKIKRGDKEEEFLLPEELGITPVIGDKITVSVADGVVTALEILPPEANENS